MRSRPGKVVTFYSFKGGVGRTMALANVAFLAAMNGSRVLVMDWDLEAPGVPYYFRGQLEPSEEGTLAMRPGVLDLAALWTRRAKAATSQADVDALVASFHAEDPFGAFTGVLVPPSRLPPGARLDVVTSGATRGEDPAGVAYEETLADFSWPDFFGLYGGGLLVDALRKWSRANYDLVLIDSRTGFADVAGVCTMQLPDVVCLCFILNRQNVDGTAKVAAAIRRQRKDAVDIRFVPMRLSRQGTSEESDARAFARDALRRVGHIDQERIDDDLRQLGVRAVDGVPFYETLAPFVPVDPLTDPLTLNYAALAGALTGTRLGVQPIDAAWRDSVRRRLEPRRATVAYLAELELAEPRRAREELDNFLSAAIEAVSAGRRLEPAYVDALSKASFSVFDRVRFEEDEDDGSLLLDRVVQLLRLSVKNDPKSWRLRLVNALERIEDERAPFASDQEALTSFEEIDALLAAEPASPTLSLRRAVHRQRMARTHLSLLNVEGAETSVDLARDLLASTTVEALDPTERSQFRMAEIQGLVIRGDVRMLEGPAEAVQDYKRALDLATRESNEHRGMEAEILTRLTRAHLASEPRHAFSSALALARVPQRQTTLFSRFPLLVDAALAAVDPAEAAVALTDAVFALRSESGAADAFGNLARHSGSPVVARVTIAAAKLASVLPAGETHLLRRLVEAVLRAWTLPVAYRPRSRRPHVDFDEVIPAITDLADFAVQLKLEALAARARVAIEQLTQFRTGTAVEGGRGDASA